MILGIFARINFVDDGILNNLWSSSQVSYSIPPWTN